MIPCHLCPTTATHLDPRDALALCEAHKATAGHHVEPLTRGDRQFWNHTLDVVVEAPEVQVYRLLKPGEGSMGSVSIAFFPDRMAVFGDASPGRSGLDFRGVFSDPGYGRGWFAGDLSRGYLCGKFLERGFLPSRAAEALRETADERAGEDRDEDRHDRRLSAGDLRERADEIESLGDDEHEVARWRVDFYNDEGIAGDILEGAYGVDPDAADQLCAIQVRFAALWRARQAAATGEAAAK